MSHGVTEGTEDYIRRLVAHFIFRKWLIILGLQVFGVIRFATCVQSLKQCHTEKRRGRRIIKIKQWKSLRHRRCVERRSLFANSISNLYTKRLSQNSYQESVRYTSVALCAVGTSVTLRYLRSLCDSVCLICKSFSLSLHISEGPFLLFCPSVQ